MPCEINNCSNNGFADQLIYIENVFNINSDCHIIISGDFNVDFARDTVLLNSSCDTTGIQLTSQGI